MPARVQRIDPSRQARPQRASSLFYYSKPRTKDEEELSKFLSRASQLAWNRNPDLAGDHFSYWEQPKSKRK